MIKIIEGREDILKQKAEYEAEFKRRADAYDAQYDKYEEARYQLFDSVKEEIERQLGTLASGNQLYINVRDAWDSNLAVHIDNGDNPHDDTKALAWKYDVELRENGEVVKETGSWSGLNGTTPEQLENLEYTVEVLKALNNIDWKNILNVVLPEYGDYVTMRNPKYDKDKPDFDAMLFDADVKDAIGKNILFHRPEESSYSRNPYYKVVSETPKNYNVAEIYNYYVTREDYRDGKTLEEIVDQFTKFPKRIAKDKFRAELGKNYEMISY